MGRRDYRHREERKPRKGAKRPTVPEVMPAPVTVEVVKRGRKEREAAKEEE